MNKRQVPEIALVLLALLLAFVSRFLYLGSAEYQGDEARALHLASGIYHGAWDLIFIHKKGPIEIVLPLLEMFATGQTSEFGARAPFALLGVVGIALLMAIAHEIFGRDRWIAPLVGFIAVLEGIWLAFSRIVQYQSPLLCCALGATYLALRGNRAPRHYWAYYLSAGGLYGCALLAHYDAILLMPMLVVAVWGAQLRWQSRILRLVIAAAPALSLTLLFYLPFFMHEQYQRTRAYLGTRIGAGGFPYNNIQDYLTLYSFYNALYFVVPIVALFSLAVAILLRDSLRQYGAKPRAILFLAVLWGLFVAQQIFMPQLIDDRISVSIALAVLTLTIFATPYPLKIPAVGAFVPLIAFTYFSARPNTHFYVAHPAVILIIGYALCKLREQCALWHPRACYVAYGLAGACSIVAGYYLAVVFLRQEPEYKATYPKARSEIYRASYGDKLPKGAYFGFPHRSGWQVIGALYHQGVLLGSYGSNEERLITDWYIRGQVRDDLKPDFFFVSSAPVDAIAYSTTRLSREYRFIGRVYVDGRKGIDMYELRSRPERIVSRYDLTSDYRELFKSISIPEFSGRWVVE